MLDTTVKIFEKLLTRKLQAHIVITGNAADSQYRFRAGKSTINAMSHAQFEF